MHDFNRWMLDCHLVVAANNPTVAAIESADERRQVLGKGYYQLP
jgi:hypothetical protein